MNHELSASRQMKTPSKLIHFMWLVVMLVMFGATLPIVAAFSTTPISFGYDGRVQVSIAYDRTSLLVFDYDSAPVSLADEMVNRRIGTSGTFAKSAGFLAAETPMPGLPAKIPADLFRYAAHPTSRVLSAGVEDGTYVFVQDIRGIVHIADNGPHMHPQVLGNATAVASAGEITIQNGVVVEINNLSGTFKPAASTLNKVGAAVEQQGLTVSPDAIKPFQWP
jgi:hypothetical protein